MASLSTILISVSQYKHLSVYPALPALAPGPWSLVLGIPELYVLPRLLLLPADSQVECPQCSPVHESSHLRLQAMALSL